jgi:hypothetical protein
MLKAASHDGEIEVGSRANIETVFGHSEEKQRIGNKTNRFTKTIYEDKE